jgi:hypothetical protein
MASHQRAPLVLSLLAIAGAAVRSVGGCWQEPGDFMGGDLEPLGVGFRNATSAGDCCRECALEPKCTNFAFEPKALTSTASESIVISGVGVGPPHNCWLKSSVGTPAKATNRVRGGVNGTSPPGPAPSPASDACVGNSSSVKPAWCNVSLSVSCYDGVATV